jgi:hypothetical protein
MIWPPIPRLLDSAKGSFRRMRLRIASWSETPSMNSIAR